MRKTVKRNLLLILLVLAFIMFDIGFYNLFTKRFINKFGERMAEKSVNLEEYLPFNEDSKIVKLDSEFKLEGELPILDGATALYPVYSAIMNSIYPENKAKFNGKDFDEDSLLQKRGTTKAYKALVDGETDIIFCAGPSEKQLKYAEENNVELEMIPIGKEAFVFIVNANNRINNLSTQEVKDIYLGKYKNWSELGGEYRTIMPLQRAEGSGSQTAMTNFMGQEEFPRNKAIIGRAIGYSFRYYVEEIVANGGIKMISLNNVYPSIENIRNDKYPIVDSFYAIYRKDNSNENIKRIIDWILSEEGQELINETGYVSVYDC